MNQVYEQIYAVVEGIPRGKVMSYGQIARIVGQPRSARMVGRAMRHCPPRLPWHRVVMSDGAIAEGAHGDFWRALLEAEGVSFLRSGRVDMAACRWLG